MTDKNAGAATDAPTPETDEVCRRHTQNDGTWYLSGCNELSALARRLERERDAARRCASLWESDAKVAQQNLDFHIGRREKAEAALAEYKRMSESGESIGGELEERERRIAVEAQLAIVQQDCRNLTEKVIPNINEQHEAQIAKKDAENARLREFAKACAEKSTESYGTRAAARLALGEGVRAIVDEMRNAEIDAARKGRG